MPTAAHGSPPRPLRALDRHALRLHLAQATRRGGTRAPARRLRPSASERAAGLRRNGAGRRGRAAGHVLPPSTRRDLQGHRPPAAQRDRSRAREGRRGGGLRPQVPRAARERDRGPPGGTGGPLRRQLQPHAQGLLHLASSEGRGGQGLPAHRRSEGHPAQRGSRDRREREHRGAGRRERGGDPQREHADRAAPGRAQHEGRSGPGGADTDP